MSKKFFMKTVIITVSLMIVSIAVFWWGSGKLFTEDYYYPQAVIACPLLFVIALIWLIADAREYIGKKPYAEISQTGIQVFGGLYNDIGLVPWREITDLREMAASNSSKGRRIYFYARYPEHFMERLTTERKKKLFQKRLAYNGNALLMIETNRIDCDLSDLKKTVAELINQIK